MPIYEEERGILIGWRRVCFYHAVHAVMRGIPVQEYISSTQVDEDCEESDCKQSGLM